jgi:hypothetical protein
MRLCGNICLRLKSFVWHRPELDCLRMVMSCQVGRLVLKEFYLYVLYAIGDLR